MKPKAGGGFKSGLNQGKMFGIKEAGQPTPKSYPGNGKAQKGE